MRRAVGRGCTATGLDSLLTANSSDEALRIVILCNRSDLYLTKICVASIRHYYPSICISIVKDELNGSFSTRELEKTFHVDVLDLGVKRYGWGVGKIALLCSEMLPHTKILLLDSDIVFIGKVLDKLLPALPHTDFIVSPEYGTQPDTDWFARTYYRMTWAATVYPDHAFPGYTFNTGQMVVTPGRLGRDEVIDYVDLSHFPYWTSIANEHLPTVDQSLLNILLPLKAKRGELRLTPIEFQVWSESPFVKHEVQISKVGAQGYPLLIHWAGALRVPYLKKMTRGDILLFYQDLYYQRVRFGTVRRAVNQQVSFLSYYLVNATRRYVTRFGA